MPKCRIFPNFVLIFMFVVLFVDLNCFFINFIFIYLFFTNKMFKRLIKMKNSVIKQIRLSSVEVINQDQFNLS